MTETIPFRTLPKGTLIQRDSWLQIDAEGYVESWCLDNDGVTPIRFKDYCKMIWDHSTIG